MNKYKNSKTIVDGHKFDSQKEARYYGTLKMRKLAGEIKASRCKKRTCLMLIMFA